MLDQSQSMADSGFLRTGAVADLGSREGRAPSPWESNFFKFHAVFGKVWQIRILAPPPEGWHSNLGKSWIRHLGAIIKVMGSNLMVPAQHFQHFGDNLRKESKLETSNIL